MLINVVATLVITVVRFARNHSSQRPHRKSSARPKHCSRSNPEEYSSAGADDNKIRLILIILAPSWPCE